MTTNDEADAPYWAALAEGRLALPCCDGCGAWQWPAVSRCGACGTWGSTYRDVAREGRVFTWTRTHHPFGGTEGLEKPFVSVVVELPQAGGIRLMGLHADAATDPRIGDAVTGEVAQVAFAGREVPVLRWRRADAGDAR